MTYLTDTFASAKIADRLTGAGVRITVWAKRAVMEMQLGRMKSVLHAMSDDQLGQIGITRSQIDDTASKLMSR